MSAKILTTSSQIQCPHQGKLMLSTKNSKIFIEGFPALLESDINQVVGCTFVAGVVPSPCITVRWTSGAKKVKVNGTPLLIQTSIGTCYNPSNAPQGIAIIVSTQTRVSAQ